jgi:hypothetical protein
MSRRTYRSSSRGSAKSRRIKQSGVTQEQYRDAMLKSCEIVETTVLTSPNRTALALVRVGDTLAIEFRRGPPSRLVAMTTAGTAAGAVDCSSTTQIAECIKLGVKYNAKVLCLRRDFCRVRVRRRRTRPRA